MSGLAGHVQDYLRLRRALGFKLRFPGQVLPDLAAYLQAAVATTVTAELAIAWAGQPQGVHPIVWSHRLGAARDFARYLKTIDPATEIPPDRIWPATAPRRQPVIFTDGDITRLIQATRTLNPPLRAATYEAMFGLIAATGLRLSEATGLDRADTDLGDGVLTIRGTKSGRDRLVPLHPTASSALAGYARRRLFDAQATAAHEPHAQSRAANGAFRVRVDSAVGHKLDLRVRREHEALARVPAVVGKLDAV